MKNTVFQSFSWKCTDISVQCFHLLMFSCKLLKKSFSDEQGRGEKNRAKLATGFEYFLANWPPTQNQHVIENKKHLQHLLIPWHGVK